MPKYIDFDALGVQSCNPDVFVNKGYAEGWNSLIKISYDAPAADVEPKRGTGWWIPCDYVVYDGKDEILHYPGEGITCSRCRYSFRERYLWRRNYCPSCGAEMRDEPPKEDNDE